MEFAMQQMEQNGGYPASRLFSLPKNVSIKWIITDEEETVPQSIVIVVTSEEPIRSFVCVIHLIYRYIVNLNSSTIHTCRQMNQKVSKVTSLFYTSNSISYCSPFAGLEGCWNQCVETVYNLSEQGKESLWVSLPKELKGAFEETRSMVHRQVVLSSWNDS